MARGSAGGGCGSCSRCGEDSRSHARREATTRLGDEMGLQSCKGSRRVPRRSAFWCCQHRRFECYLQKFVPNYQPPSSEGSSRNAPKSGEARGKGAKFFQSFCRRRRNAGWLWRHGNLNLNSGPVEGYDDPFPWRLPQTGSTHVGSQKVWAKMTLCGVVSTSFGSSGSLLDSRVLHTVHTVCSWVKRHELDP